MAISPSGLLALRILEPKSIINSTLVFFEFLKYETDDLRNEKVVSKNEFVERFYKMSQKTSDKNQPILKKVQIKKDFDEFSKKLDNILLIKNDIDKISEIKWEKITEICDLLRRIERSDERKTRWAIYYSFSKGNKNISIKLLEDALSDVKIKNLEKQITRILNEEYASGLDASFDSKKITINHETSDKLVGHYLCDDLEEVSRRSPGKLEEDVLELLDEGSYSNQEISKILFTDEAMISRAITKLRNKNKLVLSSFGLRGSRFYTTNCQNCPFGKTISSCRKDALSYIITIFKKDYGIDLSSSDFDDIEANQALLQMKRIFMMAQKGSNAKLEHQLNDNLTKLFSRIIKENLEVAVPENATQIPQIKVNLASPIKKLPTLYQMGLHVGAQSGIQLIDNILKKTLDSIKKQDREKIKIHAMNETNKFLKIIEGS